MSLPPKIRSYVVTGAIGPLAIIPALNLYGALYYVGSLTNLWEYDGMVMGFTFIFGFFGLIVSYPLTIAFGLPSIYLLRYINKFSLRTLLAVSLVPAVVLVGFQLPLGPFIGSFLFFGYLSISVALGCWYAFRWAAQSNVGHENL